MPGTEERRLAEGVGRAIAKRRGACGLTQEQVAERLGIGVEAVSRMERGVALPTVVRLGELAEIFGCNIADLVTETSSRASDQAHHLAQLLARMGSADRAMVVDIVETLASRLGKGK
ncbi:MULTISPECIES: helix-turn-helix domain-containing protein [Achromobacter]|uniref:helix-turn-helix domain-containing protein n=1 Tax=Achromobacter dolens TaxID=1287738 RepID=UPI0006BF2E98|nr:helix-turn-helix transcriptional regulator [Achromobacter dolens]CUI86738.1 anaerobic benzoate catabolism transcriptional regulator [Achromobacter dolens]